MQRIYPLNHAKMNFYFKQSPSDFIVKENNLYEFSGEGEHLIYFVRKKNLTTWELLNILAAHLGVSSREFGYAGLKDKSALTYQYISMHKSFEQKMESFSHEQIKIISKTSHKNKLKIGHLEGNSFFIRFKRVSPLEAQKIKKTIAWIEKNGMPNYFGHQRFSTGNIQKAKELIEGKVRIRDKKERTFLLNAYQSDIFNSWLKKRIEISKLVEEFSPKELLNLLDFDLQTLQKLKEQSQFLKLLEGDLMMHYPYGKVFELDDITRFIQKDISLTGPLFGKKMSEPSMLSQQIEKEVAQKLPLNGARRYAWIFPEIKDFTYKEEQEHFEINLFLPKGSYATVFIEMVQNENF